MDIPNLALAILGIGILVAIHEFGHHLVALATGMRVRRFSVGFGKPIFSRRYKDVDYTVGAIPLGGFVDVVGMNPLEEGADTDPKAYGNRPRWARLAVIAAGPGFNYALAVLLFFGLAITTGEKATPDSLVEIGLNEVKGGSAAEAAGLKAGDVLVAVAGDKLRPGFDLREAVATSAGKPISLTIRRDGQERQVDIAAREESPGVFRLGVVFSQARKVGRWERYGVAEALWMAGASVWAYNAQALAGLAELPAAMARWAGGGETPPVGGPVAIVSELKTSAEYGIAVFIKLLAVLSVMLGLFNLLPIPPLDGSKLVLLVAEAISRRAVPGRVQVYMHFVGFLFMVSLMLLVTIGDVKKLLTPDPTPPAPTAPAPSAAPAPSPAPSTP